MSSKWTKTKPRYPPTRLREEENLYILPDGRYLPCGVYRTEDGGSLIYEPSELSFFGQMLAQFKEC